MFSIGNDELEKLPDLGKEIICPHCGEIHKIQYGETILPDGTTEPSTTLAFYVCNGEAYLAGVDGKALKPAKKEQK